MRTLVLGVAALAASLALPVTLVTAQDAAPATDPGAGQTTTTTQDPPPPPAPVAGGGGLPATGTTGSTGSTSPSPDPSGSTGSLAARGSLHSSRSATAASSASVGARDNFFTPPSVTVQVGDTVTWSNGGHNAHTVTANGGGFDSGNLNPGQSFSQTFTQPGTVAYYCKYHRSLGMKGTITVKASGGAGGGGGSPGGGTNGSSAAGTPSSGATTTGPGSESAAGSSPGAAGTSARLPSTGLEIVPLAVGGGFLLAFGALVRRRARRIS